MASIALARPRSRRRGAIAQREPVRLTLEGGDGWINTGGPIHLEELRGKIVLLDFWTYCCINCHHVLPDLAKLEEKYKNELVVIGVHTPKFVAEQDTENIRKKVREYGIKHPVINDANQVDLEPLRRRELADPRPDRRRRATSSTAESRRGPCASARPGDRRARRRGQGRRGR